MSPTTRIQNILVVALCALSAMGATTQCEDERPTAVIYRGPATSPDLPESVAKVLQKSPLKFNVVYAGPNENVDITDDTLSMADLYVQPGGGDLAPAWHHMESYSSTIQSYVSDGGRYLGFCLGAYLAGHHQGYGLLPPGQEDGGASEEIYQNGAQVANSTRDTVIQVDWSFATGRQKGTTASGRWLYFQDGAVINVPEDWSNVTVLGRYSSNGDVAAAVTKFGDGWVGTVGPHPEAGEEWYEDQTFTNPDGIKMDIATDFVMAIMGME